MRLNLFSRYKSQINDDILQQKRDAMRDFLQEIEIINGKAKFYPDNYRDFIKKINEYAKPSFYDELYADAYMIDNCDIKIGNY